MVFLSIKAYGRIKCHLSENHTFKNLLKHKKNIGCKKFLKHVLAFDQEYLRELLNLIPEDSFSKKEKKNMITYMTLWLKFLLYKPA